LCLARDSYHSHYKATVGSSTIDQHFKRSRTWHLSALIRDLLFFSFYVDFFAGDGLPLGLKFRFPLGDMPRLEIDRYGDVVLELTSKDSKDCNGSEISGADLLVSSKVLTLASPVFSAMLSPRFREGQRTTSGTLDPIPLPEDDIAAMTILCYIFHFNYSAVPAKPDLELFKNLALMCDKYDCVAPLGFISEQWLLKWEKAAKKEELETLLFISYMFDRPERFSALSTRIIKEFTGNLKRLETLIGFDTVPYEILSKSPHSQSYIPITKEPSRGPPSTAESNSQGYRKRHRPSAREHGAILHALFPNAVLAEALPQVLESCRVIHGLLSPMP
jgi:hypothetical protein